MQNHVPTSFKNTPAEKENYIKIDFFLEKHAHKKIKLQKENQHGIFPIIIIHKKAPINRNISIIVPKA